MKTFHESEGVHFDEAKKKVARCAKKTKNGSLCSQNALFQLNIKTGTSAEKHLKKVAKCRKHIPVIEDTLRLPRLWLILLNHG